MPVNAFQRSWETRPSVSRKNGSSKRVPQESAQVMSGSGMNCTATGVWSAEAAGMGRLSRGKVSKGCFVVRPNGEERRDAR